MNGIIRRFASFVVPVGIALAAPVMAPPSTASPPLPHSIAAKKATTGTLKVTLSGTGSYTVKRKGYSKKASASKSFRVKPGTYTIIAKGATVKPGKVVVKAGKTAKVKVAFPAPVTPPPVTPPVTTPPPPAPKFNPGTLTTGVRHACAIDTDGKAWCWGTDSSGQLGDGPDNNATRSTPVEVAGGHRFTWISAGDYHTCAVDAGGKAWCWGLDADGEVGDGIADQTSKAAPVAVDTDTRFVQVDGSYKSTCAIDVAGKAWCWGSDAAGQAGDGNDGQANNYSPVAVASAVTFVEIAVGTDSACGVADDAALWCWGSDALGQIGDGDDGQGTEYAPVPIAGTFTDVSVSANTCAVDTDGKAWCWGSNSNGLLGSGIDLPGGSLVPMEVTGSHVFTEMAGGPANVCGLATGGQAWCWGITSHGQLGDGIHHAFVIQNAPVAVVGDHTFTHIALGTQFACALDSDGKAWCWGWDFAGGNLGDGDPTSSDAYEPRAVAGGHTFARTY